MKLSGIRYLGRQGLDNIWKNRMMAFASFCVLLVSLLLVGISILFYINLNSIIGGNPYIRIIAVVTGVR